VQQEKRAAPCILSTIIETVDCLGAQLQKNCVVSLGSTQIIAIGELRQEDKIYIVVINIDSMLSKSVDQRTYILRADKNAGDDDQSLVFRRNTVLKIKRWQFRRRDHGVHEWHQNMTDGPTGNDPPRKAKH